MKCISMDFVSHQGITLMLIGWSVIQHVCVLDVYLLVPFHLMIKKSVTLEMFQ